MKQYNCMLAGIVTCFTTLFFAPLIGCGTAQYPPDWPKLFPCKVTVTKSGAPLDGVQIFMTRTSNHGSWAVGGTTDSNGVAVIETSWSKAAQAGAPEGTFKVTLQKPLPPFVDPTPQSQLDTMDYEARKVHDEKMLAEATKRPTLIPEFLSRADQTPVEVQISNAGSNELSVEIDEYVKK